MVTHVLFVLNRDPQMQPPNKPGEGGFHRQDKRVGVGVSLTKLSQPVCHLASSELQKELHNSSLTWLCENCHHVADG